MSLILTTVDFIYISCKLFALFSVLLLKRYRTVLFFLIKETKVPYLAVPSCVLPGVAGTDPVNSIYNNRATLGHQLFPRLIILRSHILFISRDIANQTAKQSYWRVILALAETWDDGWVRGWFLSFEAHAYEQKFKKVCSNQSTHAEI
jgi:hypothetical protein